MTEHFDPRALKSSAAASIPSTARLQDTVRQDRLSPYPPSSNERTDNAPMQQADGVRLPKRLRANTHATTQVSGLSRSHSRATSGVRCRVSLRFQANGLVTMPVSSSTLCLQAPPPPDPLDADPFALMASQSHLLEGNQLLQMQRGNSSNVTDMERLPTPNIADLEVGACPALPVTCQMTTLLVHACQPSSIRIEMHCTDAGWSTRGSRFQRQS